MSKFVTVTSPSETRALEKSDVPKAGRVTTRLGFYQMLDAASHMTHAALLGKKTGIARALRQPRWYLRRLANVWQGAYAVVKETPSHSCGGVVNGTMLNGDAPCGCRRTITAYCLDQLAPFADGSLASF
jgi:hypothetical protein